MGELIQNIQYANNREVPKIKIEEGKLSRV